jgi:hypothetical protein
MTKLTEQEQHDKIINLSEIAREFELLKQWLVHNYSINQADQLLTVAKKAHINRSHIGTEHDLDIAQKRYNRVSNEHLEFETRTGWSCWTVHKTIGYSGTDYYDIEVK